MKMSGMVHSTVWCNNVRGTGILGHHWSGEAAFYNSYRLQWTRYDALHAHNKSVNKSWFKVLHPTFLYMHESNPRQSAEPVIDFFIEDCV